MSDACGQVGSQTGSTRSFDRIARYLAVGALSTAVDVTLFALLHVRLGVASLLANTASYAVGILGNYALQRLWTFRDRAESGSALGQQFAQFLIVSLSALTLNNLLVFALGAAAAPFLGSSAAGFLFAKLAATVVGTLWGFAANTLWTFRPAAHGGD